MNKIKYISLVIVLLFILSGCSTDITNNITYYQVSGLVYHQSSQYPVQNASVTIDNKTTVTNTNGYYLLSNIAKGLHTLKVEAAGYQLYEEDIYIDSNAIKNINLTPIEGNGTISGYVTIYNSTGYTTSSYKSITNKQYEYFIPEHYNMSGFSQNYKNDEIIIKYKSLLSSQSIKDLENSLTYINELSSMNGKIVHYKIPQNQTIEEIINIYINKPEIEWVEPVYLYHKNAFPNDPFYYNDRGYYEQWGHINVNIEAAWDYQKGNKEIIVAVIDSGIIPDHPDLVDNLLQGADFVGKPDSYLDYNMTDKDPTDETSYDNGGSHGTHVAGIIGAVTNNYNGIAGVNWDISILPVRVLGKDGSGYSYDIADGIDYAISMGADVINLSLGGPDDSILIHEAIIRAVNAGITVVAAAGNGGIDYIGDLGLSYPAAYPETIAVGAVDYNNNRASYSNYGPDLDLVAPGGDIIFTHDYKDYILSTWGYFENGSTSWEYVGMTGTSMATPYVTGVAALLIASGVSGPENIRNRLTSTAIDLGISGKDNEYGWGLIDAYAALLNKKLANPYVFAGTTDGEYIYIKSELKTVEDDGGFTLNNVQNGDVYLFGWRDVNENNLIDAGDYFGQSNDSVYVTDNSYNNVNIDMYYVSSSYEQTNYKINGIDKILINKN